MTYLEEAMSNNLLIDQLYYEEILEQVYVERDFMLSCFRNNIIMEAGENTANNANESSGKKKGLIKRIIEFIQNLFNKFFNRAKYLVEQDKKWLDDNLSKLKSINYDGLEVRTYKFVNTDRIMQDLVELQATITKYDYNDIELLKKRQTKEDILKTEPYNRFTKLDNDGSFENGIKNSFRVGEGKLTEITLTGKELKIHCPGTFTKYVTEYLNTTLPTLQNSKNNLERILKNVEKRVDYVKESFCCIENAMYEDTELKYLSNADIIFEAKDEPQSSGDQNNEQQKTTQSNNSTEERKIHTVVDNKPDIEKVSGDNKKSNSEYYNYIKITTQLNQFALGAAMTACEERYHAYMNILKGVVNARTTNKK